MLAAGLSMAIAVPPVDVLPVLVDVVVLTAVRGDLVLGAGCDTAKAPTGGTDEVVGDDGGEIPMVGADCRGRFVLVVLPGGDVMVVVVVVGALFCARQGAGGMSSRCRPRRSARALDAGSWGDISNILISSSSSLILMLQKLLSLLSSSISG